MSHVAASTLAEWTITSKPIYKAHNSSITNLENHRQHIIYLIRYHMEIFRFEDNTSPGSTFSGSNPVAFLYFSVYWGSATFHLLPRLQSATWIINNILIVVALCLAACLPTFVRCSQISFPRIGQQTANNLRQVKHLCTTRSGRRKVKRYKNWNFSTTRRSGFLRTFRTTFEDSLGIHMASNLFHSVNANNEQVNERRAHILC